MFRFADKALAQFGVLRGNTDRAGIQVTLAHHDTALGNQRRGGKTELVGTQQGADNHVTTGTHTAIHLHRDSAAQVVQYQGLMGFGQADLPGRTGVLDRGQRAGTGTAIVTGNRDMVCVCLGDARGDRTDTDLRYQFYRYARIRVDVLQVMNQLRQVLDRVDIVVRRWRDQSHARRRVTHIGNLLVDLVARQLTALARLGALRHLDLDVIRVDQVLGGHAKTAGGNLLDSGALRVHAAVIQRVEA